MVYFFWRDRRDLEIVKVVHQPRRQAISPEFATDADGDDANDADP
jgi:hypothetical protein